MNPNQAKIWAERWPDFKIHEILSPDQLQMFAEKDQFPYSDHALDILQEFRKFIGQPFLINHFDLVRRGARSISDVIEINAKTRGEERKFGYSYHLWCAFDISVIGMTPEDLFLEAKKFGKFGGIGVYNTFVHVDCRYRFGDGPQLWEGRYPKPKSLPE